MNKIWELKQQKSNDLLVSLLKNRGIETPVEEFLNPNFDKGFHNPNLLPDFQIALDRIVLAIKSKEKIGIYADYDADGIPGAALLFKTLVAIYDRPEVFIPTRSQGYGFNQTGIDYLIESGCKLIISIDLGIREIEKSAYIKSKNIDLIITDHHEPGEKLPVALAIVNPKRIDSKYPFRELCGAGVVYKIVQGLKKEFPDIINEKFLKWNLDLVAISTISDVVPLLDENRLIAKFGLVVLAKTKNIGLIELYKTAKIDPKKIDAYNVGFQIGPRINAPGRLDHATGSFKLLTTKSKNEATQLAFELEEKNLRRQKEMDEIFTTAIKIIEKEKLFQNKIIIIKHKNWNKGVIGPVASRLVEKYFRPVIILSESDYGFDGSARSISGFDITKALEKSGKYLQSFGGHAGAAGLHLKNEKYEMFIQSMIIYAAANIADKNLLAKILIDFNLPAMKIGVNLFKELKKLEPFGLGNSRPIFLSKNLKLISHRLVGHNEKHLQIRFTTGINEVKSIAFNHDFDLSKLSVGKKYDIVYNPEVDFWNGKSYPDLKLIDMKESNA